MYCHGESSHLPLASTNLFQTILKKTFQLEIPQMKLKSRHQGKEKLKKHNDKCIYINMIYYIT